MSLIKRPYMTEKKLAANRSNGGRSLGPATKEGMEICATARLRHGLYAQAQETALAGLGEDPADFEALLAGLREEFTPSGAFQERLLNRLARVLWLVERADRSLEGEALRRARIAEMGRDNRLHAKMMRLKMTAQTLRSLARSVGYWHYVTTSEDLEVMKKLHHDGVAGDMGEIAMDLFYQLQEPSTDKDGVSKEEKYRKKVVNSFRSIFGLEPHTVAREQCSASSGEQMVIRPEGYSRSRGGPAASEEEEDSEKDDRYPDITAEDWKVREQARKLLRNILTRQVERCETQRKALLHESLAGPSPYELAAEISPVHAEAVLMRRLQDANMREARRLTNMLLKLQSRGRKAKLPELSDAEGGHDVSENKET